MSQLALGGAGWAPAGTGWVVWAYFWWVGLGPGGQDGNRGGEEPLLSSQENPRALCQLRKTVSPCQGALAARLPLSPVLSPARLAV